MVFMAAASSDQARGTSVATVPFEKEWKMYEITVPASAAKNPTAILTIRSPTWNPAEYDISGYPTNLGVRLDAIEIEPLD